ncbi:MAG: M28 family peptidase [Clostridiales Family XIII bacterium]|jgi:hypothetical protein|nr:M28 family peptidase [Clostridiales Family XIII bacterium]
MTGIDTYNSDHIAHRSFDSSRPTGSKNPNGGKKKKPGKSRPPLRTVLLRGIVCFVILAMSVTVITTGTKEKPIVQAPLRGEAPAGYDEYSSAVDPDFCKAIAENLSVIGDDPITGGRSAGSPAELEAAQFIAQTMKDIGLENVTMDKVNCDGWTFKGASLEYINAAGEVSKAILGGYQTTIVADRENLPIVWLGKGTAIDYEGIDVKGKLILIEYDSDNDWWINLPAYQAMLHGAKAVVAVRIMEQEIEDRISSNDIRGPANAPALAISREDAERIKEAIDVSGYEAGGVRQINVRLTADSQVIPGVKTNNVWGEIPGTTDEVIYFAAHYDGYYHAFFDNAIGVGLMIDMAKAFIQSGYKPHKTLRFIATGAEEWGRISSNSDQMTAAFEQFTNVRPDWADTAFVLVNVAGAFPLDVMKSFDVSVPYEIKDFIEERITSFGDRAQISVTVGGELPKTTREDLIYNFFGIPTIANEGGEGDKQFFAGLRHSSADTIENGGFSEEGAATIENFYGYSVIMLDQLPLKPLGFAPRFAALSSSYEENNPNPGLVESHLRANIARLMPIAEQADELISNFNRDFAIAVSTQDTALSESMMTDAKTLNEKIYEAYRLIQDELLKISPTLDSGFANIWVQSNITHLNNAIQLLEDGDAAAAVYTELAEIDAVKASIYFDKETCDYFVVQTLEGAKGSWAEGRTEGTPCYADDVVRSLLEKMAAGDTNYMQEIDAIRALSSVQQNLLSSIYSDQGASCYRITDAIYAILDAKTLLDSQKEEQQSLTGGN